MDNEYVSSGHILRRTRRIACDVCRERKVRCDRRRPSCERCMRLGSRCTYTLTLIQKRPSSSGEMDVRVHEMLAQMQSRLARAESQLALGHMQPQTPPAIPGTNNTMSLALRYQDLPGDFPDSPADSSNGSSMNTATVFSCDAPQTDECDSGTVTPLDLSEAPWGNWMCGADFMSPLTPTDGVDFNMDDLFGYMGPTSTPTLPNHEVSDFAITQFHNSYFDTIHQVLPMINQSRFGIVNTSSKPELNALKYAVAMVGATAHEDGTEAAERCYNLARSNLEQAERGDADEPFMTIAAVQSLVLIVYYELKKKTFTRTWMSVGRCMRLTKALGLDHMDHDTDLDGTPPSILLCPF